MKVLTADDNTVSTDYLHTHTSEWSLTGLKPPKKSALSVCRWQFTLCNNVLYNAAYN